MTRNSRPMFSGEPKKLGAAIVLIWLLGLARTSARALSLLGPMDTLTACCARGACAGEVGLTRI